MTRLRAGRYGDRFPAEARNFFFLLKKLSDQLWGQPTFLCCVKLPGNAGNQSRGFSVEVKSELSYVSIPSICLPGLERCGSFSQGSD